ncbi:MAG: DUF1553 domain-containing protein [Planctomycetes bacterium]|nr:DUF1553 domain-containing protein [Planctomycetota bacterium]
MSRQRSWHLARRVGRVIGPWGARMFRAAKGSSAVVVMVAMTVTVSVWAPAATTGWSQTPARKAPSAKPEPRPSKEALDFFEKKIRPVLVHSCYQCHAGDATKAKGHFVLDTHDGLRKGGDSGAAITPGQPDKSLLIEALKYEGLEMPPDGPLPDEVVEDFERWVEMGAPDPRQGKAANSKLKVDLASARRYWAFQPPKAVTPPQVEHKQWPRTEIDRFILARLEAQQLTPVPDADRVTLLRRVTFDLTGLPPTPSEIDSFLADTSSTAFATVVDRLLASPRFGERWGRHWLDVVRYGESTGKERNVPYRYAWRYRDYVIDSFNADKPYDKFIIEQLAGDLLQTSDFTERNRLEIATGFLAIGPKSVNTNNPEQFKVDEIDDQIDVTGRAFLGLTIACARCHDHKYDPIPQTDYYAIAGIFHSSETLSGTAAGKQSATERQLVKLTGSDRSLQEVRPETPEQTARHAEVVKIEKQIDDLRQQLKQAQRRPAKTVQAHPGARRTAQQKPAATAPKIDPQKVRAEIKKLDDRLNELEKVPTPLGNYAMGVRDAAVPADFRLLVRGELKDKGPAVPRGVLTVLRTPTSMHLSNPKKSGRLFLASWIADKSNPLTARVMVNRVWTHLFGQGLVESVDNFGALGSEPTHPELLDHLAVDFMHQNWSMKKLIRSIVLSRTYQLSSQHDATNYEHDPDDKWLWRMRHRRLEAEAIRDAMLQASGQLNLERPLGSPVMFMSNRPVGGNPGQAEVRKPTTVRSVYLPLLRGQVPEMMAVFDVADPNLIVGQRDVTTVPTQALFLMNNPFVLRQAEEMAQRILARSGLEVRERINLAYRTALGRRPTNSERTALVKYLDEYRREVATGIPQGKANLAAWTSLCQVLFQSAEFRTID